MRIAVSGTHGSGKSTLIDDFLAAHPDYAHEPEPAEWLDELPDRPSAADFYQQLEISVQRLAAHAPGARMIAERSPLDFVAYLQALADLRRERTASLVESANELAARGLEHIDLLVVAHADEIEVPEPEDPELREAMNERLRDLIDRSAGAFRVIEVTGPPNRRLAALERALLAGR